MKHLLSFGLMAVLVLGSCQSKAAQEEAERQKALADASRQELTEAIADRDELLSLVNEISSGMEQIKSLENILTATNNTGEMADRRRQILEDIATIQQTMQKNRERLATLERKLAESNKTAGNLRQTIATLNAQIDAQTEEIASLKQNLVQANMIIGELDSKIDTLTQTVSSVTAQKVKAERESQDLTEQLNVCYYAIGTKTELKDHGIIDGGFMRKTKVMEGEFDTEFFLKADRRSLQSIDTHSRKAEVLTRQPQNSYRWEEIGGNKVLVIQDPDAFWAMSKYLVIKVD